MKVMDVNITLLYKCKEFQNVTIIFSYFWINFIDVNAKIIGATDGINRPVESD